MMKTFRLFCEPAPTESEDVVFVFFTAVKLTEEIMRSCVGRHVFLN